MSEAFYVYEHWRPDTREPFYVGKGKGRRAFELTRGRNQRHRRIVQKLRSKGLEPEVRIILDGLDEVAAYEKEKAIIAHWREHGARLSNMTAGGEGFSDPTGEIAAKISIALIGRPRPERSQEAIQRCAAAIKKANRERVWTEEACAKISTSNRNRTISEATRKRMSVASSARRYAPYSEERREKIGAANSNPSPATREKMRAAKLGKKLSAEHRAKIAKSLKGRPCSEETRAKLRLAKARNDSISLNPASL